MRIRNIVGAAIAATGLGVFATVAQAAPGVVTGGVNLRAGPDVDYPLVAQLPAGTPAEIFGCLPGWTWCDIAVNGGLRGWAAGPRLQVLYGDQPAYLPQYGAAIGLPFIGFDFNNYWGRYYRGRPWFSGNDRWAGGHGDGGGHSGWDGGGYHGGGGFAGPHGRPGGERGPGPGGFNNGPRGEHGYDPRGGERRGDERGGGQPGGERGPQPGPQGGAHQGGPQPQHGPGGPGGGRPGGPGPGPQNRGGEHPGHDDHQGDHGPH